MACPYFYPVARFESSGWVVPPRLPLGDAYTGECRAVGAAFQPEETKMREVCNLGYGRSRCELFPQAADADAIRFHVSEDAGQLIRIQFVFEKDCWPKEHGVFEFSGQVISGGLDNEILRRQAGAFVESYLRRRS